MGGKHKEHSSCRGRLRSAQARRHELDMQRQEAYQHSFSTGLQIGGISKHVLATAHSRNNQARASSS